MVSISRKFVIAYVGLLLGCPQADKQNTAGEPDTDPGTVGSGDTTAGTGTGIGATEPGTGTTEPGTTEPGTTTPDTGTTAPDTGTTAPGEDTGPDTDTDEDTGPSNEDVPQECMIGAKNTAPFVTGDFGDLDETCVVLASAIVNEVLEMTLECPIFAMGNGGKPIHMKVENVPLPAAPPQVGESLGVVYQIPDFEGFFDYAQPELLFLHRDGALLHAVIHGYFLTDEDLALVDTHALPLAVALVQGACVHVGTGWSGGDGTGCVYEAVAQLKLTGDAELLLSPGQTGEVAAGGHTYVADVREAYHRTECVDQAENIYYTMAIARK
ncbi:MAG TPA: hypothetical protein VGB85_13245 [Nannocystis sp.]